MQLDGLLHGQLVVDWSWEAKIGNLLLGRATTHNCSSPVSCAVMWLWTSNKLKVPKKEQF